MTYLILIAVILAMISIGLIYREDIIFLFKPDFWIMLDSYSSEWDKALNILLDDYEIESHSEFHITIHGYVIWISNYPYGSYTLSKSGNYCKAYEGRPSRKTILRVKTLLDEKNIKAFDNNKYISKQEFKK